MTNVTIPPAALEAAEEAMLDAWERGEASAKVFARAACLAMLENWPGAWEYPHHDPALVLPLPKENTNAEA